MRHKHILTTQQFSDKKTLEELFKLANKFEIWDKKRKIPQFLKGMISASVFYEPSTRTRFSFESAMLKLGGEVLTTENAGHFSSAIKGESLEDSIRIIGGYCDAIVIRHYEVGAAERAAKVSLVPIINAGDGAGEHPTQALLDIYTIWKEVGRIDGLKIAMLGDLLHGRTIHSLIHLLPLFKNIEIFLVSPKELKIPQEYKSFLRERNSRNAAAFLEFPSLAPNKSKLSPAGSLGNIKFTETEDINRVLPQIDVLYTTRIQKERFKSLKTYERVKNSFVIDEKSLKLLPKKSIIMHPLPRVSEINPIVDNDQRAAYFRQAKNGLYIRMALLKMLLA